MISHLGQHTVVINESSTTAATAYWLLVPVNYGLAREPEVGLAREPEVGHAFTHTCLSVVVRGGMSREDEVMSYMLVESRM